MSCKGTFVGGIRHLRRQLACIWDWEDQRRQIDGGNLFEPFVDLLFGGIFCQPSHQDRPTVQTPVCVCSLRFRLLGHGWTSLSTLCCCRSWSFAGSCPSFPSHFNRHSLPCHIALDVSAFNPFPRHFHSCTFGVCSKYTKPNQTLGSSSSLCRRR